MNKIFLITGFKKTNDNSTEPVVEELTYEELLEYRKTHPYKEDEIAAKEAKRKGEDTEHLDSSPDLC